MLSLDIYFFENENGIKTAKVIYDIDAYIENTSEYTETKVQGDQLLFGQG
jgi:hypothetical protein